VSLLAPPDDEAESELELSAAPHGLAWEADEDGHAVLLHPDDLGRFLSPGPVLAAAAAAAATTRAAEGECPASADDVPLTSDERELLAAREGTRMLEALCSAAALGRAPSRWQVRSLARMRPWVRRGLAAYPPLPKSQEAATLRRAMAEMFASEELEPCPAVPLDMPAIAAEALRAHPGVVPPRP